MSSEYDRKIFKAQSDTIEELRELLRTRDQAEYKLAAEIFRLKQIEGFYLTMQKAVLQEPALHDEWKKLIAMLKLYVADDIPGITSPLNVTQMFSQEYRT